jgi:hypothetical protein
MTVQDIIAALDLPGSCRVDQRVPKKLLVENGAPTASDKRQINDGIEEIQWLAALKPNTIGVPEYRDDVREYLEIAVLSVTLRGNAKAGRLAELVHRAVPYPMVLLLNLEQTLMLSLAHKRWAQNEVGKVVLDGDMVEVALPGAAPSSAIETAFMQALALARQPQATLYALYQGWMDNLEALLAARLTGSFKDANSPEQAAARRQGLRDCQRLELEAVSLRAKAAKEKQLARQVELNLALRRVQAQLAEAREQL